MKSKKTIIGLLALTAGSSMLLVGCEEGDGGNYGKRSGKNFLEFFKR